MYSFENESPNWLPGREPEPLARLSHAAEAYTAAQLERGFRTLDFYKSLRTT